MDTEARIEPAPRVAKRRLPWGRVVAALVVAAALVPAGVRAARGPEVPVVRVAKRPIVQKVVANGRVLPLAQVSLGVLLAGVVADVRAEEGQHVRAGDVLLRLEDDELDAAAAQAKAGLAAARARAFKLASFDALVASEDLGRADADLAKAKADRDRTKKLVDGGSLAATELEDKELALQRAEKARAAAAIRAHDASAGGGEARTARATIEQAEGVVAQSAARLRLARIVAPADGTILSRAVEPGDVVQPAKALLVMARDGETRLLVQPDERNLAHLAVGMRARVSTEAFPGEVFDAEIRSIAPSVDSARGTVDVKLVVPQPPAYLRAGMTVSVDVTIGRRDAALVVTADAVRDATSPSPWALVLRDGRVARAPVKVGLRGEATIEVLDGLAEGDLVVRPAAGPKSPGDRARPRVEE
jgi:HlyD family secretion protein